MQKHCRSRLERRHRVDDAAFLRFWVRAVVNMEKMALQSIFFVKNGLFYRLCHGIVVIYIHKVNHGAIKVRQQALSEKRHFFWFTGKFWEKDHEKNSIC